MKAKVSYNRNCKWFSMEYVGNPGAVPACNQKAILEAFDCTSCQENPDNQKKTNADHIRAMTDEELAEYLFIKTCEDGFPQFTTKTDWLDWLRQGR